MEGARVSASRQTECGPPGVSLGSREMRTPATSCLNPEDVTVRDMSRPPEDPSCGIPRAQIPASRPGMEGPGAGARGCWLVRTLSLWGDREGCGDGHTAV